jgi:hypothetical protein
MDLYIAGGRQKRDAYDKEEWHVSQTGLILRINTETGTSETCIEYVTPSEACAVEDDPSILFTAAAIQEEKLYVCTRTEVLVYELPHFTRIAYISLPCFNDLHHVQPTPAGTLLIANTGLDMVLEITQSGEILREWDVLGETPWEHFSRDVDYRKLVTTKPHRSHPNYVYQSGDDIWVTRFEQKDAVCLTRPGWRIEIGIERPHDGIVFEGSVYYTTVDGHIVVANLQSRRLEQIVNLNEFSDVANYYPTRALGWCRGLAVLDREHVIVGFSHIRPTRWRANVQWAKRSLGMPAGQRETRISLYNIAQRKLYWDWNLENLGMDIIHSIHVRANEIESHGIRTLKQQV